jgi:hypothetical protein
MAKTEKPTAAPSGRSVLWVLAVLAALAAVWVLFTRRS